VEADTDHASKHADSAAKRNPVLMQQPGRRRTVLRIIPQGGAAGFFCASVVQLDEEVSPWHSV